MKLYLVNTLYLDEAVLTEDAFKQLIIMQGADPYWSYGVIDNPTDDDIADALYWDEREQAFMSGAFDV